jgi:CO/xanthine dehydrogenase Mo-binding subunit
MLSKQSWGAMTTMSEETDFTYIGKPVQRRDAVEKVTGSTRYISDLTFSDMAIGRILRLPYPHAIISVINTDAAKRIPGVFAVIVAQDLGSPVPTFGPLTADQPVLAATRIRFQGEPVAAVAAVDAATANEAIAAIEVECDELPATSSLEEALHRDAPLVVEADSRSIEDKWRNTNVVSEFAHGWGESPKDGCEHVLKNTYNFSAVHHYAVEPYGCVASWDGGRLTVWSGVQHPFVLRSVLASVFEIPLSQVRVVVPPIGGSFGGKGYPKVEPIAAALASAAKRPVKLQLSVQESFHTARRASARIEIETGAGSGGEIVYQNIAADFLVGAYRDISDRVVKKSSYLACGPYRTPNARIVARAVASHTPPSSAFRGFGAPQFCWALESQMDELAHEIGMDPLDIRLRNLPAPGDELIPGDLPVDGDWRQGLRRVAKAVNWQGPRGANRGKGLAIGIKSPAPRTVSMATVVMNFDASVTVQVGTTEMGQGSSTVLAQVAAEVLQIPLDFVTVSVPDTDSVPFDSLTASSRSTTLMGRAVFDASLDVKAQLRRLAEATGIATAESSTAESRSSVGLSRGRDSYRRVLELYFGPEQGCLIGQGMYLGESGANALGGPAPFWEVAFSATEVEVDPGTGQIHLIRHVGASDIGRAINPALAIEQHHGAALMGIGHTLFEEMKFSEGQLLNGNLVDYRIPTFNDLPAESESFLIENFDGPGPYGAKGVGESGILSIAPSIANALHFAANIRIRDLPLTPERVWRAIDKNRASKSERPIASVSSVGEGD